MFSHLMTLWAAAVGAVISRHKKAFTAVLGEVDQQDCHSQGKVRKFGEILNSTATSVKS